MKNILYIGNNLNNKTSNISGIKSLGTLLDKEGYAMFYASSKNNKVLRLLDMVLTCLKLSKKVDIVLIDTYSTQNFNYAYVVSQMCRLLKLDYIPILHGGNLATRLKKHPKLCKAIFNHSKCNVAPSKFLKVSFENYGYQNIVHIPNAISIENYPIESKSFNEPRLLWVRSFSKIYNPELAIHVFKNITEKYPNATLCMVGPDSDGSLSKVKNLAKKFNLDVKFTGKLEKQEWITLSRDYNVFINTTNFDNLPVSVIEAMALGFPVVSTNVGGIPYLISNNKDGILVEPNHAEAMTSAVISVVEDAPKRDEIMKNARKRAICFSWSKVKPLWENTLS